MINDQELLFVVDENNNPLESKQRNFVHSHLLWHRTTGIWVINNKKQILCQKRSLKKDVKPGFWEAYFGGHVLKDEDYMSSAVKEVKEEMGIKIHEGNLIPYKIFKSDKFTHKEFQHIFAFNYNEKITNLKFERDEIDELGWREIEDVKDILLIKKDPNWVLKPWDEEVLGWLENMERF